MTTRQQLEQLLNNPNARQMLDIIAKAEGVKHGYNTLFGNQRIDNLNAHPNIKKTFRQTDGKTNYTTAAGRYQFINDTWRNSAKKYGLNDFSPRNQDIAALGLIAGRGALNQVLSGDFRGAINKLGAEWASLPSSQYAQPKRTWAQLGLGNGPTSQAPQARLQGLTVDQLTAKYGKPKAVNLGQFTDQPKQQGLTVDMLTKKYGAPKTVDLGVLSGGQSQSKTLTVDQLTKQYGAPKTIDLNSLIGQSGV